MALTTESYNANGTQKEFTVASTILSESHVNVHFYYDDGGGFADHPVASNLWDLLGTTILFKTAPTSGYVVKITVSSDGEGLDTAPTAISDVASNINKVINVSDNMSIVSNVNDNIADIGTVAGINGNVTTVAGISGNVTTVAGISGDVTTTAGISGNITTVAGIASKVTIASNNVADITNFADVYQGGKASDPATRNDATALQAGDLYFNTTDKIMKSYNGSAWEVSYLPASAYLSVANNLSDLGDLPTALVNLGLNNVDNTSDLNKPISTATQTALDGKLELQVSNSSSSVIIDHDASIQTSGSVVGTGVTLYPGDAQANKPITTSVGSVDITNKTQMESFSYPVYLDRTSGAGTFGTLKWSAFGTGTVDVALSEAEWDTGGEFAFANNGFVTKNIIKGTDVAYSHSVVDGVRGVDKTIRTDKSESEWDALGTITSFTSSGIEINSYIGVNEITKNYRLEQIIYTHFKYGKTDGVKWIECYNPITGFAMRLREGSNNVINIPHSLGRVIKYSETKRLNGTNSGYVFFGKADKALQLYSTTGNVAEVTGQWNDTLPTENTFTFLGNSGAVNQSGGVYIDYYSADSDNIEHLTVQTSASANTPVYSKVDGSYLFTANTDYGDNTYMFVVTKYNNKVVSILLKSFTASGDWELRDYARGFEKRVKPNLSVVELTSPYLSNVIASTEDSKFDWVTDGNLLAYTYLNSIYTDGKGNGGYQLSNDQLLNGTIDFSTASDGVNWVAKEKGLNSFIFSTLRLSYGHYEKTSADDNRPIELDGKWYQPSTEGEILDNVNGDNDLTTGWSTENCTLSVSNGVFTLVDQSPYLPQAYQTKPTVIGETYIVMHNDVSEGARFSDLYIDDVRIGTQFGNGVQVYEFVATNTSTKIGFGTGSSVDQPDVKFTNPTVFKKASSLGTPYTNPISWFRLPYQVANGTPQLLRDDIEPLPEAVFTDIVATGNIETKGEFVGKNVITASGSFDGASTVPTVDENNFNFFDIARVSTGVFDLFFNEDMDTTDYKISGSVYALDTATRTLVAVQRKEKGYVRINTIYDATLINTNFDIIITGGKKV